MAEARKQDNGKLLEKSCHLHPHSNYASGSKFSEYNENVNIYGRDFPLNPGTRLEEQLIIIKLQCRAHFKIL